jgi:hypothetical protein
VSGTIEAENDGPAHTRPPCCMSSPDLRALRGVARRAPRAGLGKAEPGVLTPAAGAALVLTKGTFGNLAGARGQHSLSTP